MATSQQKRSVGILGGGVIGLCTAYYLLREGFEVTILDRGDFTGGCSFINAGMVVPSHVIPLAAPGVLSKGFRWLLRPDSPFAIHPQARRDALRWAWLFYRAASQKRVMRSIPLLRDISWLSTALYEALANDHDFQFGYHQRGLLMLYQSEQTEREEVETARLANEAGVRAEILTPGELGTLEPDMRLNVRGGIYFPGDGHLDPGAFMAGMKGFLVSGGVRFIPLREVTGFETRSGKIERVLTPEDTYGFDQVVIALGSWSEALLKMLGLILPIQGGKGYSFNLEQGGGEIRIPSLLLEGRVAVTPLKDQLRIGGTMEIGGRPGVIDPKRIRGILHTLGAFYPGLPLPGPDTLKISSGMRPCSPDGLPYIGYIKPFQNLVVATGHGMMGMSLGPATGKLVTELITGKPPSMDLSGFDPGRYT